MARDVWIVPRMSIGRAQLRLIGDRCRRELSFGVYKRPLQTLYQHFYPRTSESAEVKAARATELSGAPCPSSPIDHIFHRRSAANGERPKAVPRRPPSVEQVQPDPVVGYVAAFFSQIVNLQLHLELLMRTNLRHTGIAPATIARETCVNR